MKPIDISGPAGTSPRAVATTATPVRGTEASRAVRSRTADASAPEALSVRSAGDSSPVDAGRVAEIRKAIEEGRYPLIPTRVADAMIAAGYLLRTK